MQSSIFDTSEACRKLINLEECGKVEIKRIRKQGFKIRTKEEFIRMGNSLA